MRIGKDEIGIFGGVGLLVLFVGIILAVYGFLTFEEIGLAIVGSAMFFAGLMVYYVDLFNHRKRRQQVEQAEAHYKAVEKDINELYDRRLEEIDASYDETVKTQEKQAEMKEK